MQDKDDELRQLFGSAETAVKNLIVLGTIALITLAMALAVFWSAPD